MEELFSNQFFTYSSVKENKFRDSFINDAQFNRYFLKDLNKLCTLKELFQIKQYLHIYGRLDYIYHLVFTVFSETPEKPRYEKYAIDDINREILKLIWEYLYGSGYGESWQIPLLPNPNDYKMIISQDKIEEKLVIEKSGENFFDEPCQGFTHYTETEKELILEMRLEDLDELDEETIQEDYLKSIRNEILKVEGIKVGHNFKSNKEACKFIGIEYKDSTNSRKAQEKEFSRRWLWHKEGRKIVIDEAYQEIKEKDENRGKSNGSRSNYKGIYAEYMDVLLLQYLQKQELKLVDNCKINTTNNIIAEAVGIVNCNYRIALSNRQNFYESVKKDFNIKENYFCMLDVFDSMKTKIRDIVKSSLDRLKNLEKLDYDDCYFVFMHNQFRETTEDELKAIICAEKETMQEMGIEDKRQIYRNQLLTKEFRVEVLKKVNKDFKFINSIFKGYTICLYEDLELKSEMEIEKLTKELNELVINGLKERPIKIREKVIRDEGLSEWVGSRDTEWKKWNFDRLSKKYIEHSSSFINILCNIESENIKLKIVNYIKQLEQSNDKMIEELFDKVN